MSNPKINIDGYLLKTKADKSELTTKANTSANNFTAAGKANIVGWGLLNYGGSYVAGAFPFTAPSKCIIRGYVDAVGAYIDVYAYINGIAIKITNTNVYAHSSFYFPLEKNDIISFSGYVNANNCTVIPIRETF